jgi:hypothetical protein
MAKRGKGGGSTDTPKTVPDDVLSKLAEKQKEAMEALRREMEEFSNQASKSFELAAAAAEIFGTKLKDASDRSDTSSQSLESLTASLKKLGKAQDDAAKSAGFKKGPGGQDGQRSVYNQISKSSKDAKTGTLALAASIQYLGKALKAVTSIAGGLFEVFKSAISWITDSIMAVWDFFSGIYEGLFDMAKDQMQYLYDQQRAAEEIRENFGDITKSTGKAVLDFGKSLASASIAGLGAMQVFENAAEAIRFANEVASASPAAFDKLQDQFRGQRGNNVVAFAKGLGIATQELGQLMGVAISTGRTMEGLGTEITKYSKGLASRFGVDSKLISKSMTKAMLDVKHFANATVKEIGQAAVYAHKLGLELDKITGIMDAFDTFDTAAENVSKLSQAFGVNIDVMELISAKTPAEALNKVKQAFNAAGKSADQMNRQELKLLATTLNMDEATIKQALSAQNQGESLENIKDAGNSVEKQMMSTGEALKEVSQDIKRVVRELQITSKGFFSTFLDGFYEGIATSSEMRKVLGNMAQAIQAVFAAGRELGRAFVTAFPGVKKMLDALAQFFNPADIGSLFGGFTDAFKKFFKDLDAGTGDVKTLFQNLWKKITDFFDKKGTAGSQFLQGLTEFWHAVRQIIATSILGLGDLIADAFNGMADAIEKKDVDLGIGSTIKKASKEMSPIGNALLEAFKKVKGPIGRVLKDLWDEATDYIGERLEYFFKEKLPPMLETFFTETLPNIIWKSLQGYGKLFLKWINNDLSPKANLATTALFSATLGPAMPAMLVLKDMVKLFSSIRESVNSMGEKLKKIGFSDEFIKKLKLAAKVAMAVVNPSMAVPLLVNEITSSGSPTSGSAATPEPPKQVGSVEGQASTFSGEFISEEEKRRRKGDEMIRQTTEALGVTTIDNVEERLKKIKEIGAKISGNKDQFKKDMDQIRADLQGMNFSLFNDPADEDKFKQSLGGLEQVLTFTNTIKSVVVSIEDVNKVMIGLGDSTKKGSIVSNFIDSISSFTNGMSDIFVLFKGGKMSDGTILQKGITISNESLASISTFSSQLYETVSSFGLIEKSIKSLKDSLDGIIQSVGSIENIKKNLSEKINSISTSLIVDFAPLASLMGSVDGDGITLSELFEKPADWTKAFEGVAIWGQNVNDFIEGTIMQVELLLPKADKLVQTVNELNAKITESFAKSVGKDIKIDVGEVGGEIQVKNPSINMQISPNINLQLKFNVSMDAKELEKIMVTRQDSVVVKAMNIMATTPTGGSVHGLPNQGIQVNAPANSTGGGFAS